jgi:acetylornithine/N-succinyldiaminopimelate aminotransferase
MTTELSAWASVHGLSTVDAYARTMMRTFGQPQLVLARGEGAHVWDEHGRRYLDLLAGLAVNALGHAHPFVNAAVTAQLATLGHISNFFASTPQVALAGRLIELVTRGEGSARVFLTNSGTEANEAAVKITRLTGRRRLVATTTGFHGRSIGALSITGKSSYREPFEPLLPDVTFVPFGDPEALRAAVDGDTAAVVLEPVQGEAGVLIPPAGYLAAAREITSDNGALLWLDEVQTGIGRCGEWFLHHTADVRPDLVTVAKGLGNGFPLGACLGLDATGELLGPGSHGSTFGGNPVAAVAGLATLTVIERDGILANVRAVGAEVARQVRELGHPLVVEVRQAGLLIGIELSAQVAPRVVARALEAGFIVNAATPSTVRLAPPLIITGEQLGTFVSALPRLLDQAVEAEGSG